MIKFGKYSEGYQLTSEIVLNSPREVVFAFFADALNLPLITPKELKFEIITPAPITMAKGLILDYKIRIFGFPIEWRSEISTWDPPNRFIDEQRRGPYRFWIHEHTFTEYGDKTLMRDTVNYGVPGGALVHIAIVQEQLRRIFTFRQKAILERFPHSSTPSLQFDEVLRSTYFDDGVSLAEASEGNPLLVVFLRHSGCTFCREMLAKIATLRGAIESKGVRLVLVHMGGDSDASSFFGHYSLGDVARLSDPNRKLYEAFGLARGTLSQVLGGATWRHAIFGGAILKHGVGYSGQDVMQLPGSFLLHNKKIVNYHAPESAADEANVDLVSMCKI